MLVRFQKEKKNYRICTSFHSYNSAFSTWSESVSPNIGQRNPTSAASQTKKHGNSGHSQRHTQAEVQKEFRTFQPGHSRRPAICCKVMALYSLPTDQRQCVLLEWKYSRICTMQPNRAVFHDVTSGSIANNRSRHFLGHMCAMRVGLRRFARALASRVSSRRFGIPYIPCKTHCQCCREK